MKRVNIHALLADELMLAQFNGDMAAGAVAVIPTDTLYGFAVGAGCRAAVHRIYRIKNRDAQKPLILFLQHLSLFKELFTAIDDDYMRFLELNWPGALTAVVAKPENAALAAFDFATIGVRIPGHSELLRLLAAMPGFLLTTSANRSGNQSDMDPDKIADEFATEIDWLIDDGVLPQSKASTVVDFTVRPPQVLRPGMVYFNWPDVDK